MIKNKISLILLILLLSTVGLMSSTKAQGGTVGVSEGDWFKWSYSYILSGGEPIPAQFEIEWIKFLVSNVSGTLVTGELTVKYNNGTENTETTYVDVDNSNVTPPREGMVISTNYSKNDAIANVQNVKIDKIVTLTYFDEPREMFHSTFTSTSSSCVSEGSSKISMYAVFAFVT